ncbi:tetratricopeptide repeat protein [Streptomyces sp. PanSC9]|uniref:tetratricopeptide repeat protein n=1 Tax=Streptomyces sp. PanSC9 TaxID=1520461 RepID=UPI000FA1AEC3|nr:tetratricopeptide repeat protein [Streptomyces sp. PanSC9]ROP50995.1 tetratricopeptide repeat protein [Streptomyces sp. PanSC9]
MNSYGDRSAEYGSEIRQRRWDVFISHAREDSVIANLLADALTGRGRSVWMAKKLRPKDSLQTVEQALRSSGVVIILLSPASLSSQFLRYEVAAALQALPKGNVIPIAVGEVDLQSLPLWLSDRQWLHLRDEQQVEKLVSRLLPRIEAALGESDQSPGRARILGEMPARVPLVGVREHIQQLQSRPVGLTWLIGEPGAGKTSLAREYAFQARHKMRFICWLPAMRFDAEGMCTELLKLNSAVFDKAGHGLIVVDELDSLRGNKQKVIEKISELARNHRVVVTTRQATDGRLLRNHEQDVITIGLLSRSAVSEYLDLLTDDWTPDAREKLKTLAQYLPGSPVMLRLAMSASRLSSFPQLGGNSASVESTIGELLRVLTESLSKRARRRLYVLSFCSDLLTLIQSQENWTAPEDEDLFVDLLQWGICVHRGGGTFFSNDLIVDFLRKTAPREALEEAVTYVAARLPDPGEVEAQEILGSVIALSDFSDFPLKGRSATALLDLLIWQASVWRAVGEPRRAENASSRVSSLAGEVADPTLQIRAWNLQSALAFDRGRVAEACAIERRTAAFSSRALGSDHPMSVASEANLASSLRALGELAEATSLMRRVVKKSRTLLPPGHPDRVAALTNLAICLRESDSLEEAMELLDEASSQTSNASSRLHLDQIRAALLTSMGRLGEAAELLHESVMQAGRAESAGRSDLLTTQANLAMVYARLGRLDEALSLQAEVLERFEFLHGPEHPGTLSARNNYGMLLMESGKREMALQFLVRVAGERERVLGRDHPDTLGSRILVARGLKETGNREGALSSYRSLLSDVIRVFGPTSIQAFSMRIELADQLDRLGNMRAAQLAYEELLADMIDALPVDHPLVQRVQSRVTG